MKKRMLITTIVMVLVVAIALTTSSLAWFTMSATVSISEVSFGAVAYEGAQLSVAGLARTNWGASASIGTGVSFDPSQGEPTVDNITFQTDGTWANVGYAEGTFQEASSVTTTAAGVQTANQKVTLTDTETAVFIGGFNVRNDGTAAAEVTVKAALKVGIPILINPNDSEVADGDEYYVYGSYDGTLAGQLVAASDYGVYAYDSNTPPEGGTAASKKATVEAAFNATSADNALAGGLRVAIFQRTWTEIGGTYTNGTAIRRGIYGFTNYKVAWTDGAWQVNNNAGDTNNLYVFEPTAGVYSKNANLAVGLSETEPDADYWVNSTKMNNAITEGNGPAIKSYTLTSLDTNDIATYDDVVLAAEDSTDGKSGVEYVVVVWMDGWDEESVPAAGNGRVSLAFSVTSATA